MLWCVLHCIATSFRVAVTISDIPASKLNEYRLIEKDSITATHKNIPPQSVIQELLWVPPNLLSSFSGGKRPKHKLKSMYSLSSIDRSANETVLRSNSNLIFTTHNILQ